MPSQSRNPTAWRPNTSLSWLPTRCSACPSIACTTCLYASAVTGVPLAPREIVGLLNLRGRVVTAMCLRRRLGLPEGGSGREMAVGLEHQGESYGVLVDQVGEVMKLSSETREPNPVHMDPRWVRFSRGVHRLENQLLIILDVDAVLALDADVRAA